MKIRPNVPPNPEDALQKLLPCVFDLVPYDSHEDPKKCIIKGRTFLCGVQTFYPEYFYIYTVRQYSPTVLTQTQC